MAALPCMCVTIPGISPQAGMRSAFLRIPQNVRRRRCALVVVLACVCVPHSHPCTAMWRPGDGEAVRQVPATASQAGARSAGVRAALRCQRGWCVQPGTWVRLSVLTLCTPFVHRCATALIERHGLSSSPKVSSQRSLGLRRRSSAASMSNRVATARRVSSGSASGTAPGSPLPSRGDGGSVSRAEFDEVLTALQSIQATQDELLLQLNDLRSTVLLGMQ